MPKTYQAPEQKQEHEKDPKQHKAVGVYDQPERTGPSKQVIIAIAVILAIIVLFILYRMASGETAFTYHNASTLWALVGEVLKT